MAIEALKLSGLKSSMFIKYQYTKIDTFFVYLDISIN